MKGGIKKLPWDCGWSDRVISREINSGRMLQGDIEMPLIIFSFT